MSTIAAVKLYQGQPGTTATTLYTVPASTQVVIKEILVCNTTASPVTLGLTINGTANANALLAGYSVPAYTTVVFAMSTVLAAADSISAQQGTASAITVTISGVTVV